MTTMVEIGYKEILNLTFLLPKKCKVKLIKELKESIKPKDERVFGKYNGQGWMSEDFDEPLEDFKEYMP